MIVFRSGRMLSSAVCLLILSASVSWHLSAQTVGGTISGVVTDPSGAVVPRAYIEVSNRNTGITHTVTANEKGFYTVPGLDAGPYDLTFSATGFQTAKASAQVTVGAEILVNMGLVIGSVTQIEVKGDVAQIDLASSATTASVGGQTMRELPLNGRDWTSLATLEPNVHTVDTQTAISATASGRANRGWGTELMIGGNRPQQNVYRLDGVVVNDYIGGGPADVLGLSLGVDATQEFSVVTGNAPAEYGRTSGGVINAITRAGSNDFHGSLYEFLRNSSFDARNFFDGSSVPPFKRNQFGAALGGPILTNHTFFFFDYEGLRQSLSTTTVDTVPSVAGRSGNLTTGKITVSPLVAPFLAIFPLPNGDQKGDYGAYNFVSKLVVSEDLYTARIDHTISPKDTIHGTLLYGNSDNTAPDPYDFTSYANQSNRRSASLEESHVFGPALVNFARFGFSRSVSAAPASVSPISPLASDTSLGFVPGFPVGNIKITGVTTFLGGANVEGTYQNHYNSFQYSDDLYWTHGLHSLKFGTSVERIQANSIGTTTLGTFSFGSLANFLQDIPSSFSSAIPGAAVPIYLRQTVPGFYAQDGWHVRPNLTLNVGLRYEMATVPAEIRDHLSVLPSLTAAQPHLGSPFFQNPTKLNFSPRLGFAWDPFGNGRTAVRGGFGIYDTLPLTYLFSLLTLNTEPYSLNASLAKPPRGSFPNQAYQLAVDAQTLRNVYVEQNPKRSYVEQWSLNIERQLPWTAVLQVGYNGSHGVHQPFRTNDANIVMPINPQDTAHLIWPTPAGSGTRLNPMAGTIDTLSWNGSGNYNALFVRFSREKTNFRYGVSYTWSKSIDISSSSIAGANFNNSLVGPFLFWPQLLRGLSDFNVAHNFVAHTMWRIPGPHRGLAEKVLGGWESGGIFTARTGLPFTPTIGGDPLGLLNNNPFSLPDRMTAPGCSNDVNPGNPNGYIKLTCFAFPVDNTGKLESSRLGNSGRNILIGPGVADLDAFLRKQVNLTERIGLQFRAEAFNVLNHTNFTTPDRTSAQLFTASGAPVPTAGVLTATSTSSRQLQLALKVVF